ncbi:ABC-2 family transporter protein [Sedimentibacter sp. zth1]|uniref:ABC transporter permease n=1 Tax=Sedimentibacter sp. zth1 TaxID=2816908 RepID=UPI001A91E131|nr:ABC-2 family transporter protein [Sedimentibacter sp. zth1]QSX06472.1 ABC-2 family transporter protein [Sedimentibacter sp. zth1]
MFKIFIGYCENAIKKLFMYRIFIISEIVNSLILPILLNFFLWKSIIKYNSIGYNLQEMMLYIIVSNIILLFTQIHIEHNIEGDVKTYKLGQKLLLPLNYTLNLILNFVSDSIVRFIFIYLPLLIIILFISPNAIVLERVLYLLPTIIVAFIINSLFSLIIGFFSFWTTEIWGIAAVRNLITGLLTGAVLPLDIFPKTIQDIMLYTPFPYITYIPTKVLIDNNFNIEIIKNGLFISTLWIITLTIFMLVLKNRGMKKYTSSGG